MSACSTLPGTGPSLNTMVSQSETTVLSPAQGEAAASPYTIVDIDPNSLEVLRRRPSISLRGSFGDYRRPADQIIGVGDTVSVTIWEAAAGGLFSAPAIDRLGPGQRSAVIPDQVVGRDGSITVPYAGRIHVLGQRLPQVERTIVERLTGKAIEPQVLVTLPRNQSSVVTVTGDVAAGSVVPVNVRGQRILEVIASAGGIGAPSYETFVTLIRGNRSVRVPLHSILTQPSENIHVRGGDVVALVRTPQTFTAIGATGANSVYPFGSATLTLEEALAKAGGLVDFRSDPGGVFVLRYEPEELVAKLLAPRAFERRNAPVAVSYRLNMRDPSALFAARLFAMRDKDIVYVSAAPLNEVQKIFTLINLIAGPVLTARAVAR